MKTNGRKTPLPEPQLEATTKGEPFSRCRAVKLTKDGRRALNGFGPQLSDELGSRHRRMQYLGHVRNASQIWPEVDLLFSFGGKREVPRKGRGLRYCFKMHHVQKA